MKTFLKGKWKKWGQTLVGAIIGVVVSFSIYFLSTQQVTSLEKKMNKKIDEKQLDADLKALSNPETSEQHFWVGIHSLSNNNIEAAIKNFESAIIKDPNSFDAHEKLGDAYSANSDKRDFDKAIEYYEKAIKLKPENTYIYYKIGSVFHNMRDYNKAIEYYEKMDDDIYYHYYIFIVYAYIGSGNYEIAIKCCDYAIRNEFDNIYEYYYAKGEIFEKLNYNEAIKFYNEAIALKEDYAAAYFKLGNLYMWWMWDYDNAIKYYDNAVKIQPYADAYNNLGLVYFNKQEYQKAIEYYNKAITLRLTDTDNPYFLYDNGYNNISLTPNDTYIYYYNIGRAYFEKQDYRQAIKNHEEVIRQKPNFIFAYGELGRALSANEEYKSVLRRCEEAIEQDPSYTYAYVLAGNTSINIKDYKNAIEYGEKAIKRDSLYVDAYNLVGKSYFFEENYDKAKGYFNKAIALNQYNAEAHLYIGRVFLYEKNYDNNKAAKHFIIAAFLGDKNAQKWLDDYGHYYTSNVVFKPVFQ